MTISIPKPIRSAVWDMSKKAAMAVATRLICNKYKDWDLGTTLIQFGNVGTLQNMAIIAQGSTTNTREGKSVHLKSIYIKLVITNATANNSVNRLIVVRQKGVVDTTSAASFATSLFDQSGGYTGSTLYAPIDHGAFEILIDKHVIVTQPATETTIQSYETNIPLNMLKLSYIEDTTIPTNDSIFIYALGSLAPASAPLLNGFARVLYTDG